MTTKLNDLSDTILLEKFQEGNTTAFNILFKRYHDALYNFAVKKLQEPVVAEELTMDVMMGLWKKKGEITVDVDLKAYLYRSIKNAIFNHYRKRILPTVSLELVKDQITLTSKDISDDIVTQELETFYRQKISQLSPQRRKVYELSRDENMTYAEIASDMGLSINTVENYMVASLNFFRKQLKEHADFTLLFVIYILF